ncbi:ABC transporter permease subunit [Streptomyces sp. LHD-70]|uniref:ABC transporter permease n=1 Tax=Streptomyces sp. LHD-70 TaxID=3072140 RepID=UPI00280FBC98|nr:ABC transporter permease subunit [Streptomyces sp. LHD-70]MDQ8708108.1 ABC transporter permease subunit [Streptomyces sp. LHD-70]
MFDLPVGETVTTAIQWLQDNGAPVFDLVGSVMLELVNAVLYVLTAPASLVVTLASAVLAWWARGVGFAVFTALGLLLVQDMGLWQAAMNTLAVVLVAAVLAIAVGIPAGIWTARSPFASTTVRPVLDFMQTLPVFVYLIPAVFLFGIGAVPAIVATFIFSIPPAVRLTELGVRQVDKEIVEASVAFGARPSQVLRQVQLPLAIPSITAGLNQVIMMALSMVVICGMVGAGGLGEVVVQGVSRLDIASGFEAGLSVVFLAVFLDRLTGSFPRPKRAARCPVPSAEAQPEVSGPSHRQSNLVG